MNRSLRQAIPVFTSTACLFAGAALLIPALAHTDQPAYDTVGAIEGETISVQGPLNIEVVQGHTRTILRSGSDVRVNSGKARIDLVEGGEISVCGPAHFSVLKSVNLLTIALDTGVIHAHIEREPTLTIYTAQIQAKPFAFSDAPQDLLVGFDPTGAMCVRADSGAIRLEQQLSGQSIVIPQAGEVLITNGQLDTLRSGVTHCACELQLTKTLPPPPELSPASPQEIEASKNAAAPREVPKAAPKESPVEVSRLATPQEAQKASKEPAKTARAAAPPAAPKTTENDGPVYQVYMPPLTYDANAKMQPDNFDPQFIVIVRRVRVRPTLIFQGSVKDAPVVAKNTPPPAKPMETPPSQAQQAQQKNPQTNNSILSRIRAFFRSLFS